MKKIKANFCIPADFKPGPLNQIEDINSNNEHMKIDEVYGNIPTTPYGSVRSTKSLKNICLKELEEYVDCCSKTDIDFNYTFNALTLGNREFSEKDSKKMIQFIEKLNNIGINRFQLHYHQ